VIPCYNYADYLPASALSVLSQTGVDVEVVIVDDASTDETAEVASRLASDDSRVRVLRHSKNKGHIETYNDGLEATQGNYIVLLSADDLLTPGALQRATGLMETYPNVGLVYGHPRKFTGAIPPQPHLRVRSWSIWPGREWVRLLTLRGFSCVQSPEVVLRASVHQKIGCYRPDLPYSADVYMWLRAAAISDVGRVNGPDQAFRRVHVRNMSGTRFDTALVDLTERVKAFESFFRGPGASLGNVEKLTAQMRNSVAIEALEHACDMALDREAPSEPLIELVAFAKQLSPDTMRLRHHRDIGVGSNTPLAVMTLLRRSQRSLKRHARWRRWKRNGL
jgi:glycosyltransferase involved in cell wall biosynthesis